MATSNNLVVRNVQWTDPLWPEPLNTPGVVPNHLKRAATRSFPILELFQRLLYRLRPGTTGELEKILAIIGVYHAIRPVYYHLKDFFIWAFTVQVTVSDSDPVAREILAWIGDEVICKSHTRSAMLVTGGTENFGNGLPHRMHYPGQSPIKEPLEEKIMCLPPLGTRLFWVGFRPFLFTRSGIHSFHRRGPFQTPPPPPGQLQNGLTIITPGWSIAPLQKFAELCHEYKINNLSGTTTVYFAGDVNDPYDQSWQSISKPIRKLDTIDMDEDVKSDIITDAEYYYSDQSRQYFADCGIPYRRGYLFFGPPGTGKSSFSAALAGHLRCDIYHINLASGRIGDADLHRLFLTLPRKCVVVIEDIDSTGIGREHSVKLRRLLKPRSKPNSSASTATNGAPPPPPPPPPNSNTVSLSGLLNAIDGNATQEGRLLIMTSNNPEALDAALTRPGRVDKKVYFGNMSKTAGKSIFMRLMGRSALTHDGAFTMDDIGRYAQEFADKVPANTFTPAQVQNFLQSCRGDPRTALREVDAWVVENSGRPDSNSDSRSSEMSASLVSEPVDMYSHPPPAINGDGDFS